MAEFQTQRVFVCLVGLHVVSENHRYHQRRWRTLRAIKYERRLAYYTLVEQVGNAWAQQRLGQSMMITMLRIAPRPLDPWDGLPSSLKVVKDGITDFLSQQPGQGHRFDDSPRFTWRYAQERRGVREYGVEICIEVTAPVAGKEA